MKKQSLAALCSALCLFYPAHAKAAEHPRLFGSSFGLGAKFSQGEPASDITRYGDLKIAWVRDGMNWSEIEPAAGQYADFSPAFKDRLRFYKAHNIGVDFVLAYRNDRAYPATPANPTNPINAPGFGRYAAHVSSMLKQYGVKFVLEIWNEPHNFDIQKLTSGNWDGQPPCPWVDQYMSMVDDAVKDVKAVNPNVPLMSQDDTWINQYRFLEKGLPDDIDAMSFHPYWGKSIGPEQTTVDQMTEWCKPFTVVDADGSLFSAVERLRQHAYEKLGRVPAFWATEEGIDVGEPTPESALNPSSKETEDGVAADLVRTFITNFASGIDVTLWFSAYDGPDGAFGLMNNSDVERKSYTAYKTMSNTLGDSILVSQLMGTTHRTEGVQAYLFRKAASPVIVVWNIDGTCNSVVTKGDTHNISITDVLGRTVPVDRLADGRVCLPLSQSPLYITGLSRDFSLAADDDLSAHAPVFLFP